MKTTKRILAVLAAAATLMTSAVMPVSAYTKGANSTDDSYMIDWPRDPFTMMEAKVEDCSVSYEAYDVDGFAFYSFAEHGYNADEGDNFSTVFTNTLKVYGRYNNGADHAFMTFSKVNGKTELLDAMMIKKTDQVIDIGEKAEELKKTVNGNIIDMKVGRCKALWSYIVYYKTDEGEFVVPLYDIAGGKMGYAVTPYDYIEYEKVYTVNELLDKFNAYLLGVESLSKYDGLIRGDADGNGKTNVRDCSKIAKTLADPFNTEGLTIESDYNMDEAINVRDCADIASDLSTGSLKTYMH